MYRSHEGKRKLLLGGGFHDIIHEHPKREGELAVENLDLDTYIDHISVAIWIVLSLDRVVYFCSHRYRDP